MTRFYKLAVGTLAGAALLLAACDQSSSPPAPPTAPPAMAQTTPTAAQTQPVISTTEPAATQTSGTQPATKPATTQPVVGINQKTRLIVTPLMDQLDQLIKADKIDDADALVAKLETYRPTMFDADENRFDKLRTYLNAQKASDALKDNEKEIIK